MKVRIYKDQSIPENPDLFVFSPTGDYGPFDLIGTYQKGTPGVQFSSLQAQYVKFGGVVYREKEYIDILSQLGLVDLKPDTLNDMLTADQSAIVVDKNPLDNLPDTPEPEEATVSATSADNYATTTDSTIPPTDTPSPSAMPDTSTGASIDTTTSNSSDGITIDTSVSTSTPEANTPTLDASSTPSTSESFDSSGSITSQVSL